MHQGFRPREFRPAWWLPGAHFQTVGGRYLRPRPDPGLARVRLETPDGDFLDLDLTPDPGPDAPIVLLLHGLEGSTARAYIRLAMAEVIRRNMRAVGMNFRTCSGEPNRLTRFYHSGETGDLTFVLEHLHSLFPTRPLGVVGFSLGGNVLLRYLGEREGAAPPFLRAAVAISVPFDLSEGARMLERDAMGRAYAGYFLRSLKWKMRQKEAMLSPLLDLRRVFGAQTVREFDEAATAPLHGFPSASQYYRDASSGPVVGGVRVPTLILHAADDPFLPSDAIPLDAINRNHWTLGVVTPRGGHVGFIAGEPGTKLFWAESEAARYLEGILRES